jgi:hypothetical protein
MKNKEKNLNEPLPKQKFKRNYILRKYEEVEAEQEIKEFDPLEDIPHENRPAVRRPD